MTLIDRDALILKRRFMVATDWSGDHDGYAVLVKDIYDAPTIEARHVVHGRWINGDPYCPVCGEDKFAGLDADVWADWQPDYCPNCGAKMDGGDDNG